MLETVMPATTKTITDLSAPRGLPVVGNFFQIDLGKFHLQLEQWCAELGPIFKIRFGPKEFVCIADNDSINEMLRARPTRYRRVRSIEAVTDEMKMKGVFGAEGDEWKMQRKVVAQALNSAHINRFFPNLQQTTERLTERWKTAATDERKVDLCRDLMRYTVDVTTHLAFGIDVNTIGTDGPVVQQHLDKVFPMLHKRINAPFPYWRYFQLPADRELERALSAIEETVNGFILDCRERMREHPELYTEPTNFLEAIIAAQASEAGANFTDEQIYANVITLLLAGEDTTANTIAWACKYFIDSPGLFARARDEVDNVLGSDKVITDPTKLKQLPFLEACINETMRLKPVGPIFALQANEPVELMGYALPAGTAIMGLTRHIAVNPSNFTNPEIFSPDRWLKDHTEAGQVHNSEAFIPFGSGPRFCPGRNLALVEIKMVLSMLCRNFDLQLATPEIPIEEKLAFALIPQNLDVKFSQRQ